MALVSCFGVPGIGGTVKTSSRKTSSRKTRRSSENKQKKRRKNTICSWMFVSYSYVLLYFSFFLVLRIPWYTIFWGGLLQLLIPHLPTINDSLVRSCAVEEHVKAQKSPYHGEDDPLRAGGQVVRGFRLYAHVLLVLVHHSVAVMTLCTGVHKYVVIHKTRRCDPAG